MSVVNKTLVKSNKPRRNTKKKYIYAGDAIIPYNIHKSTMLSFDPTLSCKTLIKVFGKALSDIQSPPDKALNARGIKWVRFLHGGKAELHFVPPFKLKHYHILKEMVNDQNNHYPLETPIFENHVGLYVPDLTPIVTRVLDNNIKYILNKREDGLVQLYMNIPGAIDYLEIDSLKIEYNKLLKKYPDLKIKGFSENTTIVKKLLNRYNHTHKHKHKHNEYHYSDPLHNGEIRTILFNKDNSIIITGRDVQGGKKWKIGGTMDERGHVVLDFSPKGGPMHISALITSKQVKFSDGNIWKRVN